MKKPNLVPIIFALIFTIASSLSAQEEPLNKKDYGFQITEMNIPKLAPMGYESIKTVKLNTALNSDTAYELSFWIFGRQLPDRTYSFPIQVFPSNFAEAVDRDVFDLVESNDIMPTLEVRPPPNFTSKGHYTFIVKPDTAYNYITVALKVNRTQRLPIPLSEAITVTGVNLKPLVAPAQKDNQDEEIAAKTTVFNEGQLAKRELIDSNKSYAVSERKISIGLYDHRNIDRDRVTIYLNNKIIVEDLELKKKKQFFEATLKQGKNTISLHAENLGEVAPNTAAIIIKSKTQEFMAVLESDLGTSQYFTLIHEPK